MTVSLPTDASFSKNATNFCALALLYCTVGGLTLQTAAIAAEEPAKAPACCVAVDPRVELMCIIFRLAGNEEYNRGVVQTYTDDVMRQFGPFRDHVVVKLAQKLRATRNTQFNAPMEMAVHLPNLDEFRDETFLDPWPKLLDRRWTVDDAKEFAVAARQFVKDTSFQEFVREHRPFYELTELRLRALLEKEAHLEWFDSFFGDRPGATFFAVPGLLNGPKTLETPMCNYGVRRQTADGNEELYCILGVWYADKQGMPEFHHRQIAIIIHEFCHSYANLIVNHHLAELQPAGEKIFPHVAEKMKSLAYSNWYPMLCESLVRACVLRRTRYYDGDAAALQAVQEQKALGFTWIEELSNLLGEYESHRQQYPSLEAFSPRLIAFFNELATPKADDVGRQG